jgi:hypothetical protein
MTRIIPSSISPLQQPQEALLVQLGKTPAEQRWCTAFKQQLPRCLNTKVKQQLQGLIM